MRTQFTVMYLTHCKIMTQTGWNHSLKQKYKLKVHTVYPVYRKVIINNNNSFKNDKSGKKKTAQGRQDARIISINQDCPAKEIISKQKRQPTEWDKIFANDKTKNGLILKIYGKLIQVSIKKMQSTWLTNGQKS